MTKSVDARQAFLACPWNLRDVVVALAYALILFLVFLFLPTVIYVFSSLFFAKGQGFGDASGLMSPFLILPLFYVALFLALKEKIFKKYNISERDFFVKRDQIKSDIVYGINVFVRFLGIMFLLSLLAILVAAMADMVFQTEGVSKISVFFNHSQLEKKYFEYRVRETGIVAIIMFLIVAPFFEELFFRGCIYTALRQRFSVIFSVIVSSFVFSLLHGYSRFFSYVFLVGIFLARIYEKRRSLVAPLTFHMLNNLTVILLFLL